MLCLERREKDTNIGAVQDTASQGHFSAQWFKILIIISGRVNVINTLYLIVLFFSSILAV